MISLADVRTAHERIERHIVRTPVERSLALSVLCGTDMWLKLECFQATGSFKLRGALNALLARPEAARVVTASAGNHGLGVARAAALLGRSATVVVAETASQAKVDALRASGAELILYGQTYDDAEVEALRRSAEHGLTFISAYNDADVVAGAGTVALEILDSVPEVRTFVVPVGGGGLISGIGVAADGLAHGAAVFGVQPEASPAVHAAMAHGAVVPVDVYPTLADGLAGNLQAGSITVDLVMQHVRSITLVSEEEIADAMVWLMVNERLVVEGAGAVGVAALRSGRLRPEGPAVVVLSGRNVAASVLQQYVHGPVRVPRV